jgi:DNA-binding beta-propeller fold protein YncE
VVLALLVLQTLPVPAASAADVTATLVRTVDLSAFPKPSSDPAGVVYLPAADRILVVDSEIDELSLFAGANLFELSRTGTSTGYGSTLAYTPEPTGMAWDQSSGTLFVTDDDLFEVFAVAAGGDGAPGTADDALLRSFDVRAFGSTDPQGVAYKASTGELFVVDGQDDTVFRLHGGPDGIVDGSGDVVASFGVPGNGRPQGIVYDAARDTLVVCDHQAEHLYELTTDGTLLSTIDVGAAHLDGGCDVAVAPSSSVAGGTSFWVTTRGVESADVAVQNDGRLFELRAELPARPATPAGTTGITILSPPELVGFFPGQYIEFRAVRRTRAVATSAGRSGGRRPSAATWGPVA